MDYLEKLNEYIFDEKKIVTYRWLSLTHKVPSNKAKQMLYHFYTTNKGSSKSPIYANYFISGLSLDEVLKQEVQKVCVVKEDDLDEAKSSFKVINSLHIYSIQESPMKDLNVLYGVDYDIIKNNAIESSKLSCITCPSTEIRKENEVKIKNESTNTVSTSPDSTENKENRFNTNVAKKESTERKPPPKASIASMFSRQAKASEDIGKKTGEQKSVSGCTQNQKNPLAGFLKRGSEVKAERGEAVSGDRNGQESTKQSPFKAKNNTPVKVKVEPRSKSPQRTSENDSDSVNIKGEVDGSEEEDSKRDVLTKERRVSPRKKTTSNSKPNNETKRPSKSKASKAGGKGSSRGSAAASEAENAKRKRIVRPFDSSDESEQEEPNMDECPFPSPPRPVQNHLSSDDEVIPPTPTSPKAAESASGRRKRRKLVDKTFQDEDGFLVTKKEYEMVSESDEEDPMPKAPARKSPRKASSPGRKSPAKKPKSTTAQNAAKKSPQKSKQSSIMSFFKKKD